MASGGKFLQAVQRGERKDWQYVLQALKPDLGECLLHAVREQCPEAVCDVLQYKPSLNVEDSQGQRPIHLAAHHGPAETVRLLYQAGSTITGANREGWPPLHIACRHGGSSEGVIRELISCGANVNAARTEERLTPLHVAVLAGLENNVKILMSHDADPNMKSGREHGQMTALTMAIMSESQSVLKALLENVSRHNAIVYTQVDGYPLHLAVRKGNVENCQLLLTHLKYMKPAVRHHDRREETKEQTMLNMVDQSGATALHLAILRNKVAMVEILLDAGSDTDHISFKNMLPLELAVKCLQPLDYSHSLPVEAVQIRRSMAGRVEWDDAIVRLMVERSINLEAVNDMGQHAIHLVLSASLYDMAWKIVRQMPDRMDCASSSGMTPLHLACRVTSQDRQSRLELITKLLELGLSVNAQTQDGSCPLSLAVQDDDMDVVSLLLSHSPDMSLKMENGYTPLHYAATGHNVAMLEALLEARPEAITVDADSISPLHLAVMKKKVDMARCLLQRGADPNHRDPRSGDSPLHAAVNEFVLSREPDTSVALIRMLVEGGADLAMRDRQARLTLLHSMIQALLCCTVLPDGVDKANCQGLAALKMLVEAGSVLEPWTPAPSGIGRRSPLQSMAFCGLLPCVYYLANVSWPLNTEIPSSSGGSMSEDAQPGSHQLHWMVLPGNSPGQDNLHAFLMLRHANPFSLMELARSTVRGVVAETSMAIHGGQRREVTGLIHRLPVPEVMMKFLKLQDADYSSVDYGWKKLLHLLPSAAIQEAEKAGVTS